MHQIYIIDDDILFCTSVKSMIQFYEKSHPEFLVAQIHVISNSFEELFTTITHSPKNIYIIDMDLSANINGLQIAKRIRSLDFHGYIIFMTAHIEMTAITYQYNIKALNFIFKGDSNLKHLFFSALDQIALEQSITLLEKEPASPSDYLFFSYKHNHYKVYQSEIFFIETNHTKRCLLIHTAKQVFEYPHPLKTLASTLPNHFIQIHKSIVVNAQRVKEIKYYLDQYNVCFDNGTICQASKRYLPTLINHLKTQGK